MQYYLHAKLLYISPLISILCLLVTLSCYSSIFAFPLEFIPAVLYESQNKMAASTALE